MHCKCIRTCTCICMYMYRQYSVYMYNCLTVSERNFWILCWTTGNLNKLLMDGLCWGECLRQESINCLSSWLYRVDTDGYDPLYNSEKEYEYRESQIKVGKIIINNSYYKNYYFINSSWYRNKNKTDTQKTQLVIVVHMYMYMYDWQEYWNNNKSIKCDKRIKPW